MNARAATRNRGFTLLEVMIALAIVSIALVLLLGLQNRNLLLASRSHNITRATLLAKAKMSQLEQLASTEPLEREGEFEPPNQRFQWKIELLPTPISGIAQLDLQILWGAQSHNQQLTLTSFIRRETL